MRARIRNELDRTNQCHGRSRPSPVAAVIRLSNHFPGTTFTPSLCLPSRREGSEGREGRGRKRKEEKEEEGRRNGGHRLLVGSKICNFAALSKCSFEFACHCKLQISYRDFFLDSCSYDRTTTPLHVLGSFWFISNQLVSSQANTFDLNQEKCKQLFSRPLIID